jgi:hypothetical protein
MQPSIPLISLEAGGLASAILPSRSLKRGRLF